MTTDSKTSTSSNAVGLQRIQKRWGDFSLDATLTVSKGEYMVIVGPSGCGKSLLLATIAGLYVPESGTIQFGGTDMTQTPPEARKIGFVFQHLSLFPHLSVSDNIAFGLRAQGVLAKERQQRVDELSNLLSIQTLVKRPVPTLSGGESQKVAIARALAVRPKILLLDEPLSLVDHNARIELQTELRRLHQELGLTTLHVTHNRDEARAQADRCALMFGGRIIQTAPIDDLRAHPSCLFVASFFNLPERPAKRDDCNETCVGHNYCDRTHNAK